MSDEDQRDALKRIANLALRDGWPEEGWEVVGEATSIALNTLGWKHWSCSSSFTGCRVAAVGPEDELLRGGWSMRDGRPRCPAHAGTTDPSEWPPGLLEEIRRR